MFSCWFQKVSKSVSLFFFTFMSQFCDVEFSKRLLKNKLTKKKLSSKISQKYKVVFSWNISFLQIKVLVLFLLFYLLFQTKSRIKTTSCQCWLSMLTQSQTTPNRGRYKQKNNFIIYMSRKQVNIVTRPFLRFNIYIYIWISFYVFDLPGHHFKYNTIKSRL